MALQLFNKNVDSVAVISYMFINPSVMTLTRQRQLASRATGSCGGPEFGNLRSWTIGFHSMYASTMALHCVSTCGAFGYAHRSACTFWSITCALDRSSETHHGPMGMRQVSTALASPSDRETSFAISQDFFDRASHFRSRSSGIPSLPSSLGLTLQIFAHPRSCSHDVSMKSFGRSKPDLA